MKWPASDERLTEAGYKPGPSRICSGRSCRATIEWWETPAHRPIPLHRLEDGTLQPHFADCPDVKTFKR